MYATDGLKRLKPLYIPVLVRNRWFKKVKTIVLILMYATDCLKSLKPLYIPVLMYATDCLKRLKPLYRFLCTQQIV